MAAKGRCRRRDATGEVCEYPDESTQMYRVQLDGGISVETRLCPIHYEHMKALSGITIKAVYEASDA